MSSSTISPSLQFQTLTTRSSHIRRISSTVSQFAPPLKGGIQSSCFLAIDDHRLKRNRLVIISLAAPKDDHSQSDVEVEKGKPELEADVDESNQAWKEMLESLKEKAIKMQDVSQEAYELYSKKALVIVKEASEKLKLQAEKTSCDLSVLAQEIREESEGYLSNVAVNSPEEVRDILEMYLSSTDDVREVSKVRDFYVGVPFGTLLSLGGFLSFMFSGSLSAIRFGVILGGALLALSISSLRSWKKGESSALVLKGQTAITVVIFLRELRLLLQRPSFPSCFLTFISGAILAFYLYKIVVEDDPKKGPSLEQ
ncbi:hypothetical protein GIB67_041113 [Kingdonia uniflora]|uniref:Protein FATTY ACID EXPORT 3, chloroplastic n=1 Tax=Kingdonia uniflora TaxID=39325 RepID=A0A7J7LK50_9MAGN|nr:hypothetical protein GIB67_041113 [Kingdonia uniflora]